MLEAGLDEAAAASLDTALRWERLASDLPSLPLLSLSARGERSGLLRRASF